MNQMKPSVYDVVILARALGEQGHFKEAEEIWLEILNTEIENISFYSELAALYTNNGEIEKAKETINEAYKYSKPVICAQYEKGITSQRLKQLHEEAADERFKAFLSQPRPDFKNVKDANKKLKIGFLLCWFWRACCGICYSKVF
ncbi:MAG: hypothetical protein GY804_14485 [Alphaproteobacteria bacterium]|nr:hypothetical protein [Alphaproteobacteria bacterium]